jgi:integrase
MAVFNRVTCSECGHRHNIYEKNVKEISCVKCHRTITVPSREGNYYIENYASNRRVREKVGPNRKLAEIVDSKRKVEIAEGKFLDTNKSKKIKFEVFAKEFVEVYSKVNKKSWQSDQYNLNSLGKFFAGKYLHEITVKDIENYKVERLKTIIGKHKQDKPKTIAAATVNRELATLKTMFNKAVVWKRLKENAAKTVQFLKEPVGRLRFLEQEEIIKVLIHSNKHMRPILVLALNTGMRRGEILGLKWHDVDFKRDIITLLDTKNGEKREVYMNEQVKTALIRAPKNPVSPYIFCDNEGKPYRDIRKSFWTVLRKSGIKDFHFHDLRHTFASHLVMSGIDLNTVRELLGHKDIRMTLRYSHLSPSYKRRAVDLLGKKIDTMWTPEQNFKKEQKSELLHHIEDKSLM